MRNDTRVGHAPFAWGIARTRLVGMLVEHIYHIVVVNVPTGAGVSDAGAQAIVESVAFR